MTSVNRAAPETALGERPDGVATSVGKALTLLEAFAGSEVPLGVSEVARRSGLHKSTAYRLLAVLEEWGLVERDGVQYHLGRRLFEWGNWVRDCWPSSLRDLALPYMTDLFERTHETVHLAVLDGLEVLYIEKIYGHNQVRTPSRVGGRVDAYCSALGKAMLAFGPDQTVNRTLANLRPRTPYTIVLPNLFIEEIEAVRNVGFAIDREEIAAGLTCVAAPICDSNGRAFAAISLSGLTGRFDPTQKAATVVRAANAIATAYRSGRV